LTLTISARPFGRRWQWLLAIAVWFDCMRQGHLNFWYHHSLVLIFMLARWAVRLHRILRLHLW